MHVPAQWVHSFVKNVHGALGAHTTLPVDDVIVDGERYALYGVLQIGLRNGRVVDENGRAGGRLLQ